jgi:hypothetical protein
MLAVVEMIGRHIEVLLDQSEPRSLLPVLGGGIGSSPVQ